MITSYAVDRITVVKWNGYDEWNQPNATTSHVVRGYVEWKTRLVRDIKGEEIISPIRVYLPMRKTDRLVGRALTHEDQLIVDGRQRSILSIDEPKAFDHPHYEVSLA